MKKIIIAFTIILITLSSCSSTDKHTTKTITTYDNSLTDQDRIVTSEKSSVDNNGGLFSIMGDIIAWPFRVIAATLSAIF